MEKKYIVLEKTDFNQDLNKLDRIPLLTNSIICNTEKELKSYIDTIDSDCRIFELGDELLVETTIKIIKRQ